jgi:CubicO group peptidase (beta-lactamase class C family)
LGYASASGHPIAARIDSYVSPYVDSGNFAGAVLVKKGRQVIIEKAYGHADREHRVRNTSAPRFHIASVSMQFTAAASLRLVDKGVLTLDSPLGAYVKGIPGAGKITLRDLLTERSGLPDINSFPDYNDILQEHQTPASLISKIQGRPLLFEPGTKFLHEEHSSYNLLALILEEKTGLDFRHAMDSLIFRPAGLRSSGTDDDSPEGTAKMATGYEPEGLSGVKRASQIHWSAKAGNASVYTTVTDEARFVEELFAGNLLLKASRETILETSPRAGYGWFRSMNERFDQTAYYMNGRAPGFASFVLYLPREQLTVVVFSNVYSSATTAIGYDIAAIAIGLPHTPFRPLRTGLNQKGMKPCIGTFQFGNDFYQPNGLLALVANGDEFSLRWLDGSVSPLIPLGPGRFMDRSYWEGVTVECDAAGNPLHLDYGKFRGKVVEKSAE